MNLSASIVRGAGPAGWDLLAARERRLGVPFAPKQFSEGVRERERKPRSGTSASDGLEADQVIGG